MPIYEYECQLHGMFEINQSIKEPPLDKCPKCMEENKDTPTPTKLISGSSFQLKGGGWAKQGYS